MMTTPDARQYLVNERQAALRTSATRRRAMASTSASEQASGSPRLRWSLRRRPSTASA
jgi:hypothetical protein